MTSNRFKSIHLLVYIFVALGVSGCRSVYVHPDATAEKFEVDSTRCKYNMNPTDFRNVLADSSQDVPVIRTDWKRCMVALGWETRGGVRAENIWGRH